MTWLFNRGTLLRFKLGNESADVVSFFVLLECGILLVHISILLNHGPVKFLFIDAKNWGRKWRLTAHHPHMLVHCPKNYLNICIKTESVTFRADATVCCTRTCVPGQIHVNKTRTYTVAPATGSVFMRRFRFFYNNVYLDDSFLHWYLLSWDRQDFTLYICVLKAEN